MCWTVLCIRGLSLQTSKAIKSQEIKARASMCDTCTQPNSPYINIYWDIKIKLNMLLRELLRLKQIEPSFQQFYGIQLRFLRYSLKTMESIANVINIWNNEPDPTKHFRNTFWLAKNCFVSSLFLSFFFFLSLSLRHSYSLCHTMPITIAHAPYLKANRINRKL